MNDQQTQAPQWWAAAARVIVDQLEYLPAALATWEARSEDRLASAEARRAANQAMDLIDDTLAALHALRASLISQIRTSDDAHAARVDELLARRRS